MHGTEPSWLCNAESAWSTKFGKVIIKHTWWYEDFVILLKLDKYWIGLYLTPPPVALKIIVATGLPSWFTVVQKVMFNSWGNVGSGVTRREWARWESRSPLESLGDFFEGTGKGRKREGRGKREKREKRGKEKGENVEEKGENVKEQRNCKRGGEKLNT